MTHFKLNPLTSSLLALVATLFSCSSGGGGGSTQGGQVLNLTVTLGGIDTTTAVIEWDTSLPSTGELFYGTGVPLGQSVQSPVATTHHQVSLSGLTPNTAYQFRVSASSTSGLLVDSGLEGFVTAVPLPVGLQSDDFFSNNLSQSRWSFVDPTGAAQVRMLASSTGEGVMEFVLPAGVASTPWQHLDAARLTQPVPNQDQTLQATFVGRMDHNGTGQGLVFEQDESNFARFDFVYNGNKLQLFAATFAGGSLRDMSFTDLQSGPWPAGSPLSMRVTRTGNAYFQEYTLDGIQWLAGPTLTSSIAVAHAGLVIAAEGNPAPGITMVVDSFENTADPISFEDGQKSMDQEAPFLHGLQVQALDSTTAQLSWNTDEIASAQVEFGRTEQYLDGQVTLPALQFSQNSLLTVLEPSTTYFLRITSMDPSGHTSQALRQITTPADNSVGSPSLTVWQSSDNGNGTRSLRFGQNGFGQPQVNVLGNVQDEDEDRIVQTVQLHYRLNGGAWVQITMGDDRTISYAPWRLANEGDFNVELYLSELTLGTPVAGLFENDLLLRATDDDGHATYQSLRLEIVDGLPWNPNASIDWNTVLNNGAHADDAVQIVDGKWNVENYPGLGPVLRTDPANLGYDRLVAIGEGQGANAWTNYEVELDATVLELDPQGYTTGTSSYGFGFVMHWTGHTAGGPYAQPNHNIYPLGAGYLYRWFSNRERWELWTGYDEGIEFLPDNALTLGVRYSVKLRCENLAGGGTQYRMKLWPFGSTEPVNWTFDRTTPTVDTNAQGSLLLVAHHADVAFGNIQVTQLP